MLRGPGTEETKIVASWSRFRARIHRRRSCASSYCGPHWATIGAIFNCCRERTYIRLDLLPSRIRKPKLDSKLTLNGELIPTGATCRPASDFIFLIFAPHHRRSTSLSLLALPAPPSTPHHCTRSLIIDFFDNSTFLSARLIVSSLSCRGFTTRLYRRLDITQNPFSSGVSLRTHTCLHDF